MKQNQTLHIPRWLAKFILNETKSQPAEPTDIFGNLRTNQSNLK
jgi:hypothetical protein